MYLVIWPIVDYDHVTEVKVLAGFDEEIHAINYKDNIEKLRLQNIQEREKYAINFCKNVSFEEFKSKLKLTPGWTEQVYLKEMPGNLDRGSVKFEGFNPPTRIDYPYKNEIFIVNYSE